MIGSFIFSEISFAPPLTSEAPISLQYPHVTQRSYSGAGGVILGLDSKVGSGLKGKVR